SGPLVIVPSPSGERLTHQMAVEWVKEPWLTFACGRYEGIDQRFVDDTSSRLTVREVSVGDYVVNGGEVAALVMIEAVARLLPGVLGNAESLNVESHSDGLLEAPGFTKPVSWRGHDVPAVLLSGHHSTIARWRRDEALRRTASVRPDLVAGLDPSVMDERDHSVLAESGWQVVGGRFSRTAHPVAD
ncbi:MAG TPA: tRNA (guanosine(37)-N1)-methyltransferase TrmD, partial [Actinomycetes bacterium]|nr:tRNA (guanosine(37)-N1)-methyltransferase TrmD [Actinomycetes bacterium]